MIKVTVQSRRSNGEWIPVYMFDVSYPADAIALGRCVTDLTNAGATFRIVEG